MKKILLMLMMVVTVISLATVMSVAEENVVQTTEKEMTKGTVFYGNSIVVVNEDVDGTCFLAGGSVTIEADIYGDLFVAASEVNIKGNVHGTVFIAASEVEITGKIDRDVFIAAAKVSLSDNASVERSLSITASTFNMSDNAKVNGNVSVLSEKMKISEGVSINGGLNYASSTEKDIPEGIVKGEIKYEQVKNSKFDLKERGLNLVNQVLVTLALFVVFYKFLPNFINKSSKMLEKSSIKVIGFGILSLIMVPIIIILGMWSGIGSKISFIGLGLYTMLISISLPMLSIIIANMVKKHIKITQNLHDVWHVIYISVIIWLLSQIPYVGVGLIGASVTLGLGLVYLNLFGKTDTDIISQ